MVFIHHLTVFLFLFLLLFLVCSFLPICNKVAKIVNIVGTDHLVHFLIVGMLAVVVLLASQALADLHIGLLHEEVGAEYKDDCTGTPH